MRIFTIDVKADRRAIESEVGAHIAAAPRQTDLAATMPHLCRAVLAAKGVSIEEVS